MLKHCLFFLLVAIFVACGSVQHAVQRPPATAIPSLNVQTDTGKMSLKIVKLNVSVHTTGNIAQTVFDLTFYNNYDMVLEGELNFPLLDGQNIFKYALEVNDSLREGVVVEKMRARVAFENTVRRKVDPGLVEKTVGNNFKTRVYPIPAKGYKRLVIGVEETLQFNGNGYLYKLPLYSNDVLENFSLEALVTGSISAPLLTGNELNEFSFSSSGDDYKGHFEKQKFPLNHLFSFVIPVNSDSSPITLIENFGGKTYCYANSVIDVSQRQKQKPSKLAILWDISSSATGRNEKKEEDLLRQYLNQLGDVQLSLIPFHIAPEASISFDIKNGDAEAVIKKINSFEQEGGTQLGAIDLTAYTADEFLIFSDGLSTFGKKEIHYSHKPVITISSSVSANTSYLRFLALKTNGQFIDLVKNELPEAMQQLQNDQLHIVKTTVTEGEVTDLVFRPVLNTQSISFACVLQSPKAVIDVELGYDDSRVVTRRQFVLTKGEHENGNVKRIWASMKIEELDMEYEKNKDQITSLGKEFSIVTRNTSLLVLDLLEDYVQYEIVPPAQMQKEYFSLLKERKKEEENKDSIGIAESLAAMKELKDWWKQDAPVVRKKQLNNIQLTSVPFLQMDSVASSTLLGSTMNYSTSTAQSDVPPPPPPPQSPQINRLTTSEGDASDQPPQEQLREMEISERNEEGLAANESDKQIQEVRLSKIEIKDWSPDVSYLKKLKSAAVDKRWTTYRAIKNGYQNQPSFFVDVARWFFSNNDKPNALLVLSNIAEMKLEDPELLRIMAYQLKEMGESEIALETFKDIKSMREEEPQSYRDLSLVFTEMGRYNEAIAELNAIVKGSWDARLSSIKGVALSEMNAIISAHPGLDLSAIDRRFIFAMPVDVRIVIGWSSNNSDIDLWVTDPHKEKCFYQNTNTAVGGRISRDMTQGYGPEEFLLKKAPRGNYKVEANLYGDHRQTIGGPITITAELFTDYGKPTQKRKTINFRVTENKEVIEVGNMSF